MTELKDLLTPLKIQELKGLSETKKFGKISFESALKFILTNGIFPESNSSAQGYLELEDWLRNSSPTAQLKFSATDLKNKTGEILDEVLRGKVVIIEKHGRPIAEIKRPL